MTLRLVISTVDRAAKVIGDVLYAYRHTATTPRPDDIAQALYDAGLLVTDAEADAQTYARRRSRWCPRCAGIHLGPRCPL